MSVLITAAMRIKRGNERWIEIQQETFMVMDSGNLCTVGLTAVGRR
jgi:hypothetical protein